MKLSQITPAMLSLYALLAVARIHGQVPIQPETTRRDQSALDVISHSISQAGGADALRNLTGFLATGTITYHIGDQEELTGSLTERCQGVDRCRQDAVITGGTRTTMSYGGGEVLINTDGKRFSSRNPDAASKESVFPFLSLVKAFDSPDVSILDRGTVTYDMRLLRTIRIQRQPVTSTDLAASNDAFCAREYLFDPSTSELIAVRDTPLSASIPLGTLIFNHDIRFSAYQVVNGISVPFTASERINGQDLSTIALSSITFNPSVGDADFQLR